MSSPEGVPAGTNSTDDDAAQQALADAATQEVGQADDDPDAWDEARAKRRFEAMKKDLDKAKAQVKELSPLAAELTKIRDGQKSDLEKANERAAQLESQVQAMAVANYRNAALLAAGLSPEFAEYISADTEEGAREQAEKLAKHLTPEPKKLKGAVDLRQGQRGSAPAGEVDKNDLIRRMAGFA